VRLTACSTLLVPCPGERLLSAVPTVPKGVFERSPSFFSLADCSGSAREGTPVMAQRAARARKHVMSTRCHTVPSGCTGCCGIQENNVKLTLVLWSGPAGLWQLTAALRPRGHNKCTALWARQQWRRRQQAQQDRSSTHAVLNYSNPGKELWSGHGAFRGARRRRRGLPMASPQTSGACPH
jgi:hypothetical protein